MASALSRRRFLQGAARGRLAEPAALPRAVGASCRAAVEPALPPDGIAARRDYAPAINNLAVLYMEIGQIDDAIAALRYGIGAASKQEMLYLNLARIYVQSGERAKARDVLDQLLTENPDSAVARKALRQLGVL